MASTDPVLYERSGHRVTITLNRPDVRNALTVELFDALEEALIRAASDPARVVVVTGSGNSFCAGADTGFLSGLGQGGDPGTAIHDRQQGMVAYYRRFLRLAELPMPTIAAVNGFAIGAGFAFALAADLRVVAAGARMGATFTKIGLQPGGGTSYLLPRLIGLPRALELLYTGRVIDGAEAERLGIANRVAPEEGLAAAVDELADEIAAAAPRPVRGVKRAVMAGLQHDLRANLELEAWGQAGLAASHDAGEGLVALRERRPPEFSDDFR
jgi:enoyl-CoA hydratase/carnithine racemase